MKKNNLLALLIFVIFISIFLVSNLYFTINPVITSTFDAFVEVSDKAGFNVEHTSLNFSKVPPSLASIRYIQIQAPPYRSRVIISSSGSIASWLSTQDNERILEPGEFAEIAIRVNVPEDAPLNSTRTGIVTVKLFKED